MFLNCHVSYLYLYLIPYLFISIHPELFIQFIFSKKNLAYTEIKKISHACMKKVFAQIAFLNRFIITSFKNIRIFTSMKEKVKQFQATFHEKFFIPPYMVNGVSSKYFSLKIVCYNFTNIRLFICIFFWRCCFGLHTCKNPLLHTSQM